MPVAPPQITLRELLKDPLFKKWMGKVPTLRVPDHTQSLPWRIYVLDEGRWKMTEAQTYAAGYRWVAKNIRNYEDLALTCKPQGFNPPVLRNKTTQAKEYWRRFPFDHVWCPYCRRPTVFFTFAKHHAFPRGKQWACSPYDRRCTICGVRLSFIGPRVTMGAIT